MINIDLAKLPTITSSKLFLDSKNTIIDQDGVLSEVHFGPIKNYKCTCGNYSSKTMYNGMVCGKCGVMCTSNTMRYKTFAKIPCLFPLIKTSKKSKFNKVIKKEFAHIVNPIQSDLSTSITCFLKYNPVKDEIIVVPEYNSATCIPLAISGIFTLFIALTAIQEFYNSANSSGLLEHFIHDIIVIPPNTRSTIVNEEFHSTNGILKSDIDEIYINILGFRKSHSRLFDGDYQQFVDMIKISLSMDEESRLPIIDEQLRLYDNLTTCYQYNYNQLYSKISDLLSGKKGYIRDQHMSKRIDYSSRSVVAVDASLDTHQIKIPVENFVKLYFIEYLTFLHKIKLCEYSKIRQIVAKSDEFLHHWKELDFVWEFVDWWFIHSRTCDRLMLLNRNPSLWRFSIPVVEVIGVNPMDKCVIGVSPLIVDGLNMDSLRFI